MDDKLARLADAVDKAVENVDDYADLAKVVPIVKSVMTAHKFVRGRRLRSFFNALDAGTKRLSPEERARFEDYLRSDSGAEFLADYADRVMRSQSQTVAVAFAILCSDPDHFRFPLDFKVTALRALEGLDDVSIDGLLALFANRQRLDDVPSEAYAVHSISSETIATAHHLQKWSPDGKRWVSLLNDFLTRGILVPDSSSGMRLSDENATWTVRFAFTTNSDLFAELLETARGYVRETGTNS